MEARNMKSYEELFKYLKDNLHLTPKKVMSDYEKALDPAIKSVFGDSVQHVGCWFHYSQVSWFLFLFIILNVFYHVTYVHHTIFSFQAIIKKVKKLGLTKLFNENEKFRNGVKMLIFLALLKPEDIFEGFQKIKQYFQLHSLHTRAAALLR